VESPVERGVGHNADAVANADAAVGRISGASQYVQDVVWSFVYRETMHGMWQYIHSLNIPKTDSTRGLVDIKGNESNASLVGTGHGHDAQKGFTLTSASGLDVQVDTGDIGEDTADRDYVIGFFASDFSASGTNDYIYGVYNGGGPNCASALFHTGGNLAIQHSSTWPYATKYTVPITDLESAMVEVRADGDDIVLIKDGVEYHREEAAIGAGNKRPPGPIVFGAQTNTPTNSAMAMTLHLAYTATPQLDTVGFQVRARAMLNALDLTQETFTNTYENGDSLSADSTTFPPDPDEDTSQYRGFTDAMVEPVAIIHDSESGDNLEEIRARVETNLSSHPTADSAVIAGGVNNMSETVAPTIGFLTGELDAIIAEIEANTNIKKVILVPIGLFHCTAAFKWDLARQAVADAYNAYMKTLVDNEKYFMLDYNLYRTFMETDNPDFDLSSESAPWGGPYDVDGYSGLTPTGGTRIPRVWDGIHFTRYGRTGMAKMLDAVVRSTRYTIKRA